MRYYIHISLPRELRDRVMAFRRKYQPNSVSEPHITLIIPGDLLPGKTEQMLVDTVEDLSADFTSFMVREKALGFFNHGVVFVGVERSSQLAALHNILKLAVKGILKPVSEKHADLANPHITLAENLSAEETVSILAGLEGVKFFSEFLCDRIVLLRKGPDDKSWMALREFKLRGGRDK